MNIVIQFLCPTVGYFACMDLKQMLNGFKINSKLQFWQKKSSFAGFIAKCNFNKEEEKYIFF